MATYLINGANRGIGMELCRQLHAAGHTVIAVCRRPSPELQQLGIDIISHIDISQADFHAPLLEKLSSVDHIDVLINVAGIWRDESLETMNFSTILEQFTVNTLGPMRMTMALLPKLKSGSKIAMITSRMGSIEDNQSGGRYGYRMSKAALNAAAKSFAIDLKPRGIAVSIVHPGFVATDMTNKKGIPVTESCAQLIARIDELNLENTGQFYHANGEQLPW